MHNISYLMVLFALQQKLGDSNKLSLFPLFGLLHSAFAMFVFSSLDLLFVLFISTLYAMSFSHSPLVNTDVSRCVFAPVNWKIFMQQRTARPTDWVTCCVIIIETEKNLICSLICGEQLKAMMVTMMTLIRPYCRSGEWQQRNIT